MLQLPFDQTQYEQEYSITLYGSTYNVRTAFNTREETWHLSLYDENKTPIEVGVSMVSGVKLLFSHLEFNLYVLPDNNSGLVLLAATDEELAEV